uniref:Uncharacterized protein n=1 Tax=Nelumbo nucifera TaxID=4432 RepID=A0A822YMZ6_NELNU|nr:TPA_asm: hypothetical protein HUJ06_012753 [Nelumbo nucifera]
METELKSVETSSQISSVSNEGSYFRDSDLSDDLRYTSLRDMIPNSPTDECSIPDGTAFEFDSSNISIRNQLVKQAASAYVQSAAILITRNQNCLVRLWRKLTSKSGWRSCWRIYVRNPLRGCARPIYRLMCYVVNQIGSVWGRRNAID